MNDKAVNQKITYCVVGIGELLWDLFPAGKKMGGAPANFAFHAQSLGAESYVVSAIGSDKLGQEILDNLKKVDLTDQYIRTNKKHPTGTVEVNLDAKGNPNFVIHTDVAWDYISFSKKLSDLSVKADAICFGTLAQRAIQSRQTIKKVLQASGRQCLKIFDINLRQTFYTVEIIMSGLFLANCLKLNDHELDLLASILSLKGSENHILKTLLEKFNLDIIALTKGEKGSRLFTRTTESNLPASKIRIVDTVGAGDAFTAGLAMGLLQNRPLEQIHSNASKLAAYVCTQEGATPPLPAELKKEILISR
jgi:fructokinase